LKLTYWCDAVPNFGDALNQWLWPRLLPGFFDDDPRELFIGIGSIIFNDYPAAATKLVFGSGYGGYTSPPRIDATWDIRFVRGPRTAMTLGLDPAFGLGDAATLIREVWEQLPAAATHRAVSFMPHWESALYGDWEAVCREAGVGLIDPRWPVERVLSAIRGSGLLVTEAMHGAIVADALRVPWIPFQPLRENCNKWLDWAESQGLEIQFSPSARSTWLELASNVLESGRLLEIVRAKGQGARTLGSGLLRARAAATIRAAAASRSFLTSDATIAATTAAMLACLERVRASRSARTHEANAPSIAR
jgi:hypothetical protein